MFDEWVYLSDVVIDEEVINELKVCKLH